MKKVFFMMAVIVAILSSCAEVVEGPRVDPAAKNYSIIIIDSCEYIECDYGIFDQRVYSLTHKGNCKYCKQSIK